MAEIHCNACGHRNPLGANFCSSCGAILEPTDEDSTTVTFHPDVPSDAPDEDVSVDLDELQPGTGMLVVRRGPKGGSRFVLSGETTTAGRHPASDIFLDDITVSRRHAEIARVGAGYVVRDVGSLNGTYLNRHRIEESPISSGDELQVGKFKLAFFARPAGDG